MIKLGVIRWSLVAASAAGRMWRSLWAPKLCLVHGVGRGSSGCSSLGFAAGQARACAWAVRCGCVPFQPAGRSSPRAVLGAHCAILVLVCR